MRLKKGDLVEVLGCLNPKFESFVGKRFILEDKAVITLGFCRGSVGWGSPFWVGSARFTPMGTHLRKVNPDGDELSEESFNSLMTKLKEHPITIRLPSAIHCVHVKGTIDLEDI